MAMHPSALLRCSTALIALLLLVGAASTTQAPATLQGTLHSLTGQRGSSHYQQWFLGTNDGLRWALEFDGDTNATAGSHVEVTIDQQVERKLVLQQPPTLITTPQHGRSLLQTTGTAPTGSVTMVVFIMDLTQCNGVGPAVSPQDLRQFLGSTQPISMAGMYSYCSMNQLQLDVPNSLIITVPFPCSGTLNDGTPFATNDCNNNIVPWQQFAEQYAERQGYNLGSYEHRALILPNNFHNIMANCGFDSLASEGPWIHGLSNSWGAGYVWICGDCWNWAPTWWHELGHNYGLQHALNEYGPAPWSGDYGDYMSAMGAFGGTDNRCYDAAQLWTTGWSSPAAQIDINSLVPGLPAQLVAIPMQRSGPTGLKVTITSSPLNTFTFSYRGFFPPYDKPLQATNVNYPQAVVAHRAPSNVPTTDTALVGMLSATGNSFADAGSLLSVTLVSWDGNTANLAVCRQAAPGVPCYQPGAALPSGPARAPTPVPTPVPTPQPVYVPLPTPQPVYVPVPTPRPVNVPVPVPAPTPRPVYVPVPVPAPTPRPVYVPVPVPAPTPRPVAYVPVPVPVPNPQPVTTTLTITVLAPQPKLNCFSFRFALYSQLSNVAGVSAATNLPAGASTMTCNNQYNNIQITTTSMTTTIVFPSLALANRATNYLRTTMNQVAQLAALPCGSTISFSGAQYSCSSPVAWAQVPALCCSGKRL